jgi:hypothetical protein
VTTAYVVFATALSAVMLLLQLAQGWSAVWIIFVLVGIWIAVASLGGEKYRKPHRRDGALAISERYPKDDPPET